MLSLDEYVGRIRVKAQRSPETIASDLRTVHQRFGDAGLEAICALFDGFDAAGEARRRTLIFLSGKDHAEVHRRLIRLAAAEPQFAGVHALSHITRFYEGMGPDLQSQAAEAVAAMLDTDIPTEQRCQAALFLGRHGRERDIEALRRVLEKTEAPPPDRDMVRGSDVRCLWGALTMAIARMSGKDGLACIREAIGSENARMRAWAAIAIAYVGRPEHVKWLRPLVTDQTPATPVMEWSGAGGGGRRDVAFDALAAEVVYAISEPKPEWTFKVGSPARLETHCLGSHPLDGKKDGFDYQCATLSDGQRRQVLRWIDRYVPPAKE